LPGPFSLWGQNSAGVVAGTPICLVAAVSANQPIAALFLQISES
jgi:hypothetical protein